MRSVPGLLPDDAVREGGVCLLPVLFALNSDMMLRMVDMNRADEHSSNVTRGHERVASYDDIASTLPLAHLAFPPQMQPSIPPPHPSRAVDPFIACVPCLRPLETIYA